MGLPFSIYTVLHAATCRHLAPQDRESVSEHKGAGRILLHCRDKLSHCFSLSILRWLFGSGFLHVNRNCCKCSLSSINAYESLPHSVHFALPQTCFNVTKWNKRTGDLLIEYVSTSFLPFLRLSWCSSKWRPVFMSATWRLRKLWYLRK